MGNVFHRSIFEDNLDMVIVGRIEYLVYFFENGKIGCVLKRNVQELGYLFSDVFQSALTERGCQFYYLVQVSCYMVFG